MKTLVDVGQRFNELTVLAVLPKSKVSVQCSCGKQKIIQKGHLVSGSIKSCGCYRKRFPDKIKSKSTHGMCGTRTYKSWEMMIQRCTNPLHDSYAFYGGKGITVDTRWLSFQNFYDDMGDRPQGHTLDRINPQGNYTLSNCRWADKRTQSINKSLNSKNTSGVTGVYFVKSVSMWQACIGVSGKSIYLGIFKDIADAILARNSAEKLYYPDVYGEKEVDIEDAS